MNETHWPVAAPQLEVSDRAYYSRAYSRAERVSHEDVGLSERKPSECHFNRRAA